MKKLLVFIIGLISSILCITSAFAADVSENTVQDLQRFEIIEKSDDLRTNDNVTRAEAAKIFCRLQGYNSEVVEHVLKNFTLFKDVPLNHWALVYTNTAQGEIFVGDENGCFHPDDNITYRDFLTAAVSTLGYRCYAEEEGGYPQGFLIMADKLKITANVYLNDTDYVTRADAMNIAYNMLDVPLNISRGWDVVNLEGDKVYKYELHDGNSYPLETFRMQLLNPSEE